MSPEEFGRQICSRWPTKSAELKEDILKFAKYYHDDDLSFLSDCIVREYEGEYIPRMAQMRKIAEKNNISQRTSRAEMGYSTEFGGFLAFYCKVCSSCYPQLQEGVFCPICGSHRTSNETLKVLKNKPDFVAEKHQGELNMKASKL
jgi:hypothetical protein